MILYQKEFVLSVLIGAVLVSVLSNHALCERRQYKYYQSHQSKPFYRKEQPKKEEVKKSAAAAPQEVCYYLLTADHSGDETIRSVYVSTKVDTIVRNGDAYTLVTFQPAYQDFYSLLSTVPSALQTIEDLYRTRKVVSSRLKYFIKNKPIGKEKSDAPQMTAEISYLNEKGDGTTSSSQFSIPTDGMMNEKICR